MRIIVHAKPGSKQAGVTKHSENEFDIAVIERPEKGRANGAIRRALATYLGISQSRLSFVMGQTSKTKIFEILP